MLVNDANAGDASVGAAAAAAAPRRSSRILAASSFALASAARSCALSLRSESVACFADFRPSARRALRFSASRAAPSPASAVTRSRRARRSAASSAAAFSRASDWSLWMVARSAACIAALICLYTSRFCAWYDRKQPSMAKMYSFESVSSVVVECARRFKSAKRLSRRASSRFARDASPSKVLGSACDGRSASASPDAVDSPPPPSTKVAAIAAFASSRSSSAQRLARASRSTVSRRNSVAISPVCSRRSPFSSSNSNTRAESSA